jgi:hypothetical protein
MTLPGNLPEGGSNNLVRHVNPVFDLPLARYPYSDRAQRPLIIQETGLPVSIAVVFFVARELPYE